MQIAANNGSRRLNLSLYKYDGVEIVFSKKSFYTTRTYQMFEQN